MDKQIYGWMDRQTDRMIDQLAIIPLSVIVSRHQHVCILRWMEGQRQLSIKMDDWMNGWTNSCTDGQVDGKMQIDRDQAFIIPSFIFNVSFHLHVCIMIGRWMDGWMHEFMGGNMQMDRFRLLLFLFERVYFVSILNMSYLHVCT